MTSTHATCSHATTKTARALCRQARPIADHIILTMSRQPDFDYGGEVIHLSYALQCAVLELVSASRV